MCSRWIVKFVLTYFLYVSWLIFVLWELGLNLFVKVPPLIDSRCSGCELGISQHVFGCRSMQCIRLCCITVAFVDSSTLSVGWMKYHFEGCGQRSWSDSLAVLLGSVGNHLLHLKLWTLSALQHHQVIFFFDGYHCGFLHVLGMSTVSLGFRS